MSEATGKITLDASQAISALKQTQKETKNTASTIAKAGQQASYGVSGIKAVALQAMNAMGPVGMSIAAAFMIVTAGIAAAIKGTISFANKLDSLAKQAKSVDMTVNGFLSLKHAVGLAGGDMQKIMNIVTRLEDAVVQANEGNEKYQKSFTDIGLSWLEMAKLSPEEKIMAIVSAIRRLKAEGKAIPSSFSEQLVGRKGMQDINKLVADPSFEKNVIGATASGLGMDEGTVRRAEALNDAVSNLGEGVMSFISKLQAVKWLMDNIEETAKSLTKGFTASTSWKIDQQYADLGIGIGDVADNMLKNKRFSQEQMKYAISAYATKEFNASNRDEFTTKTPLEYIGVDFAKMSEAEIYAKFKEIYGDTVDTMSDSLRQTIFKITSENDKRFKFGDTDTYIQLNDKAYNQAPLTPEAATAQTIQNIERMDISKTKELLDITEQIDKVEESINQRLSRRQRMEIEIAAQKKNQEIYEKNAEDIQQRFIDKAQRKLDYSSAQALTEGMQPYVQRGYVNTDFDVVKGKTFSKATLDKANRIEKLKASSNGEDPFERLKRLKEEEKRLKRENVEDQSAIAGEIKNYNELQAQYNAAPSFVKDENEYNETAGLIRYNYEQATKSEEDSNARLRTLQNEISSLEGNLKGISKDEYDNLQGRIDQGTMIAQQQRMYYNGQLNAVQAARAEMDLIERKNMLVEMGLKPTKENLELYKQQLDYMQKMAKAERSVRLLTSIKQGQQDFRIDMLEATGRTRQAAFEKGRIEAVKTKGSYLTNDEVKLVDMKTQQGLLMDFIKNMKVSEDVIKTNSLASRGGMVGSVYVEKNDNARKQIQLLGAIKNACELNNRIMTSANDLLLRY